MIAGSFDSSGQPVVKSRLVVPRLGVDDEVDFLVDTGADSTCLHRADGQYIRFPYDELAVSLDSEGVGGSHPYYREYAYVVFYESDGSAHGPLTSSWQQPDRNNLHRRIRARWSIDCRRCSGETC